MTHRHVTAAFAGVYLHRLGSDRPVTIAMIRTWTWRDKVQRVGTDHTGAALYDLDTIVVEAQRRGYVQVPCTL